MIRLERSTVAGPEGESPLLAVHGALQSAIELEHATIPLYLYALFSLRERENREVAAILRSVVVEEMLHMVLLANVGNALGARRASPALHPVVRPALPRPTARRGREAADGSPARLLPRAVTSLHRSRGVP